MSSSVRKALIAGAAVLGLIGAVATPASARNNGGAIAAGVVGGLALGAIAGSAAAQSNQGYGYGYAPAYAAPPPPPACYVQREPVYDEDGYVVGHRRVRVCE